MKRKIVIEPYHEEYSSVNYYLIRFADEEESEFDKFFNKFDGDENFEDDFNILIEWLDKIGEEGASDIHFRREGGNNLKAMPIETSKLRLYCFKVNDCIVILGNGGYKKTRTYQEDPLLDKCVSDLRKVGWNLFKRFENSTRASIYNCELLGDLQFEIETAEKTDYEKE